MKDCSFCGPILAPWAKNFPCQPAENFPDQFPNQPGLSAVARGFSPGDIIRNSRGHTAIVTFANDTWGDIRCCGYGRYPQQRVSAAMSWKILKKATQSQAEEWLEFNQVARGQEIHRDFDIDPITNKTIFKHNDSIFDRMGNWLPIGIKSSMITDIFGPRFSSF